MKDASTFIKLTIMSSPPSLPTSPGVLCFPGERREDEWLTGYDQLIELLGVSPATAAKALAWLKEKAIIGYHSPKNGHPTRIWLNRAAESIAKKPELSKANLRLVAPPETASETAVNAAKNFAPAGSNLSAATSNFEPAFKEEDPRCSSIAGIPPAADTPHEALATGESAAGCCTSAPVAAPTANAAAAPVAIPTVAPAPVAAPVAAGPQAATLASVAGSLPARLLPAEQLPAGPVPAGQPMETALLAAQLGELAAQLAQLRSEVAQKPSAGGLLGSVSAAVRAELNDQLAFQFNLTRDWLNNKALPQVARISQSETYKLLRSLGLLKTKETEKAGAYVGASTCVGSSAKTSAEVSPPPPAQPAPLTEEEVLNAAEAVWILAEVRQLSVEESLQQVLAESHAADERTKAAYYEQALRELVYGTAIHERIRERLGCWEAKIN
jgi:hypothetical protein